MHEISEKIRYSCDNYVSSYYFLVDEHLSDQEEQETSSMCCWINILQLSAHGLRKNRQQDNSTVVITKIHLPLPSKLPHYRFRTILRSEFSVFINKKLVSFLLFGMGWTWGKDNFTLVGITDTRYMVHGSCAPLQRARLMYTNSEIYMQLVVWYCTAACILHPLTGKGHTEPQLYIEPFGMDYGRSQSPDAEIYTLNSNTRWTNVAYTLR